MSEDRSLKKGGVGSKFLRIVEELLFRLNDNNEEAKIPAFQLEVLNKHICLTSEC